MNLTKAQLLMVKQINNEGLYVEKDTWISTCYNVRSMHNNAYQYNFNTNTIKALIKKKALVESEVKHDDKFKTMYFLDDKLVDYLNSIKTE
jgi:hypothetical protein